MPEVIDIKHNRILNKGLYSGYMNENQPLISVIVPAYNVQKSIGGTLEQLLKQSYKNIEILCINDGSKDETQKVINSFDDFRIRIFDKSNGGVSSARNVGLENANGKYITFVDPGDQIDDHFVEYLYNLLISTNSQLSICSYDFESSEGEILDRTKAYDAVNKNTFFTRDSAISEIIKPFSKFCGHVWDKMFIRSIIGDLRFDESIHNCEDTLFDYEYIKKCNKIVLGPEIHYKYVQDESSVTHSKYTEKYFTSLKAWQKILNELNNKTDSEVLSKKLSADILCHEVKAWKTLDKQERKKYKKNFLLLMQKYKNLDSPKLKAKWVICRVMWMLA